MNNIEQIKKIIESNNISQIKSLFLQCNNLDLKNKIFSLISFYHIITAADIIRQTKLDQQFINIFKDVLYTSDNIKNIIASLVCNDENILNDFLNKYSSSFFDSEHDFLYHIDTSVINMEVNNKNDIIIQYLYLKYKKNNKLSLQVLNKYDLSISIIDEKKLLNFILYIIEKKDYDSLITLLRKTNCYNNLTKINDNNELVEIILDIKGYDLLEDVLQIKYGNYDDIKYNILIKWLNYLTKKFIDEENDMRLIYHYIKILLLIFERNTSGEKYIINNSVIRNTFSIVINYFNKNKKDGYNSLLTNNYFNDFLPRLFINYFLKHKENDIFMNVILEQFKFMLSTKLFDCKYIHKKFSKLVMREYLVDFLNNYHVNVSEKYFDLYFFTFFPLYFTYSEYLKIISNKIPNILTFSKDTSINGYLFYHKRKWYIKNEYYSIEIDNNYHELYKKIGARKNYILNRYNNGKINTFSLKESEKINYSEYDKNLYKKAILNENFDKKINCLYLFDRLLKQNKLFLYFELINKGNITQSKKQEKIVYDIISSIIEYDAIIYDSNLLMLDYYINRNSNKQMNKTIMLIKNILKTAEENIEDNYLAYSDSEMYKLIVELNKIKKIDYKYYRLLINRLNNESLLSNVYYCDKLVKKDYFSYLDENTYIKKFYYYNNKYGENAYERSIIKEKDDNLNIMLYIYNALEYNMLNDKFKYNYKSFELKDVIVDDIINHYYMQLQRIDSKVLKVIFDIGDENILNQKTHSIYDKFSNIRERIINNDISFENFSRKLYEMSIYDLDDIKNNKIYQLDKFMETLNPNNIDKLINLYDAFSFYKIGENYDINKIYFVLKYIKKFNVFNYNKYLVDNLSFKTKKIYSTKYYEKLIDDLATSSLSNDKKIDFFMNSLLVNSKKNNINKLLIKMNVSDAKKINDCLKKYILVGRIDIRRKIDKENKVMATIVCDRILLDSRPYFYYNDLYKYDNNFIKKYRFNTFDSFDIFLAYRPNLSNENNNEKTIFKIGNSNMLIDRITNVYDVIYNNADSHISKLDKIKFVSELYSKMLDISNFSINEVSKKNSIFEDYQNKIKKTLHDLLIHVDIPLAYYYNFVEEVDSNFISLADSLQYDLEMIEQCLYIFFVTNKNNCNINKINYIFQVVDNVNFKNLEKLFVKYCKFDELSLCVDLLYKYKLFNDENICQNQKILITIKKYTKYNEYFNLNKDVD